LKRARAAKKAEPRELSLVALDDFRRSKRKLSKTLLPLYSLKAAAVISEKSKNVDRSAGAGDAADSPPRARREDVSRASRGGFHAS